MDFRFGENREVMCIVLKYDSDSTPVQGAAFYYRQMYLLKEDGSFAYSGGAADNGWAKLRWDGANAQWETIPVEDGSDKLDVQWYVYPIPSGEP